jgi:lysophospholipase L1-like esterase
MRTFRRFGAWRSSVAVTLVVIVAALGAGIWFKMSRVEDAATAVPQQSVTPYGLAPMERKPRPTALFIGDDFAAGYEGVYVYAYPYIVCDVFDLNCNVDAQNGTGFLNDGKGHSPKNLRLLDRLARDHLIYDANLVIIDAGRNDLEVGVEGYGKALEQYLGVVKQFWPEAKIVVIAPSFMSTEPYPDYANLISVIGPITESFGGVLIDPIADGWYNDVDLSVYQAPDHLHPNQAGHQLIAQKLAESLIRRGLLEPPAVATQ